MSLSKVGKQRIEQESHMFQETWERAYFFVEVKNVPTCLICKQSLSVWKEYNLRTMIDIQERCVIKNLMNWKKD